MFVLAMVISLFMIIDHLFSNCFIIFLEIQIYLSIIRMNLYGNTRLDKQGSEEHVSHLYIFQASGILIYKIEHPGSKDIGVYTCFANSSNTGYDSIYLSGRSTNIKYQKYKIPFAVKLLTFNFCPYTINTSDKYSFIFLFLFILENFMYFFCIDPWRNIL